MPLERPPEPIGSAPPTPRTEARLAIAVVGGGVAGATAARGLRDAGHSVTILDKGRAAGGRLSTRRVGSLAFDYGAQYFHIRDPRFAHTARSWWDEGVLAEWHGVVQIAGPVTDEARRLSESQDARVIALPGMSSLVGRMLAGLDVRFSSTVAKMVRDGGQWHLLDSEGVMLGMFDAVVLAVPAPQATGLIEPVLPTIASRISRVRMTPCWSAMVHLQDNRETPWSALTCTEGPLAWIAKNHSMPQRPAASGSSLVLHASSRWSLDHLEASSDDVLAEMLAALSRVTDLSTEAPSFAKAHRWRYARTALALGEPCALDAESLVAVCGDWCLGQGIEEAFLSGCAAADGINALTLPR